MTSTDKSKLKSFVDRIEQSEQDRQTVNRKISDIYKEVRSVGYNPKALRRVVAERKMKDRERLFADMDEYRSALNDAVEMVRDGASLRKASQETGVSKSSIHRKLAVPPASQTDNPSEDDLEPPPHLRRRKGMRDSGGQM
jgi:uncharacterized protein (UPF0335 family)